MDGDAPGSFLTVAQVADRLKIHTMTVYRLIHARKLSAVKVGKSYRISSESFKIYLREARTDGDSRS